MRRVLTTLSALLATAPLTLTAPWPAAAAVGTLTIQIEGVVHAKFVDPAPGCFTLPSFGLMSRVLVINNTDADVILYSGETCKSGFLRAASGVRAGTTRERTLIGTHSLRVQPR
ncbi:hypothetical protein GCM10022226_82890 [Sphaerisporangium flaviroseum]|uniref:Uncharacterized protein n=1 Tax=Sphaerisporangium flaviroseum TaxID=509199 RepID=A0ABP7JKH3_9ACTN